MSNRLVRINELVQRELNSYLRKRYQSEAAAITITSVEIADDLKTGKAHVAIFGKEDYVAGRMDWLQTRRRTPPRSRPPCRPQWTPAIEYVLDDTPARAARVMQVLEEIDRLDKDKTSKDNPS